MDTVDATVPAKDTRLPDKVRELNHGLGEATGCCAHKEPATKGTCNAMPVVVALDAMTCQWPMGMARLRRMRRPPETGRKRSFCKLCVTIPTKTLVRRMWVLCWVLMMAVCASSGY